MNGLYCTENFSWLELLQNQTDIPNLTVLVNLQEVAKILETYRKKLFKNKAVIITSGWRSADYNKKIGGAFSKSYHILGLAVDFYVPSIPIPRLYDLMDLVHFGGVEKTDSTWVHIDLRKSIVRFNRQNVILNSHYSYEAHTELFK